MLTLADARGCLARHGFVRHGNGRREKWKHPGGRVVVIPAHEPRDPTTLRNVLRDLFRQAGWAWDGAKNATLPGMPENVQKTVERDAISAMARAALRRHAGHGEPEVFVKPRVVSPVVELKRKPEPAPPEPAPPEPAPPEPAPPEPAPPEPAPPEPAGDTMPRQMQEQALDDDATLAILLYAEEHGDAEACLKFHLTGARLRRMQRKAGHDVRIYGATSERDIAQMVEMLLRMDVSIESAEIVAARYGISPHTICRVIRGEHRYVTPEQTARLGKKFAGVDLFQFHRELTILLYGKDLREKQEARKREREEGIMNQPSEPKTVKAIVRELIAAMPKEDIVRMLIERGPDGALRAKADIEVKRVETMEF